jgi:hypothetical protein
MVFGLRGQLGEHALCPVVVELTIGLITFAPYHHHKLKYRKENFPDPHATHSLSTKNHQVKYLEND